MGWECGWHWKTRNAYRILAEKLLGKRPLGRPKRWDINIKEIGCEVDVTSLRIVSNGGLWY
jgi:hypothetical protein